jgi:hypothetical protein
MAAPSASVGFVPTEIPAVAVSGDGRLASVHEADRVTVLDLVSGAAFAEIGVDPDAEASEIGWIGARLLVLSRYELHSTVHLLDPDGPRSIAEVRLEAPMRLYASVDGAALVIGALGAAVLAATDTHLTLYPFPSRTVPVAAGAAGSQFVIALPASVEAWDPRTRMPTKRMRLPRAAVITAVGGSERVVWVTTQQEPTRIDVIPLMNRSQPRAHELPEPIRQVVGHPRSDMLAVVGAETGKLYAVDLDGRQPMRAVELAGVDRVDAVALLAGRAAVAVVAQMARPIELVGLDLRGGDATVAVTAPRGVPFEVIPFEPVEAYAVRPARDPAAASGAGAAPDAVPGPDGADDERAHPALFDEAPADPDLGPRDDEPGARDAWDDEDAARPTPGVERHDGDAIAARRAAPEPEPPAGSMARLRALRDRSAAIARSAPPASTLSDPDPDPPEPARPAGRPAFAPRPNLQAEAARPPSSASERFSAWRDQVRQAPAAPAAAPAPVSAQARESGSAPVRESGAAAVRDPGSAPVREPGSAPVRESAGREPGSAPVRESGSAPVRESAAREPGSAPVREPVARGQGSARGPSPAAARGQAARGQASPQRPASVEPRPVEPAQPSVLPPRPAPRPAAPRPAAPPALTLEAPAPPVALSWRDELVAWTRGVLSGLPTAPITAPPIDALIERLDLAPAIQPALALLYGAHLYGERGVAPVDVSRLLGRNWDEALGRGELAQHALAVFAGSRVTIAPVVQRMLDELAPHTGILIGDAGPIALLGPCVAVGPSDEPLGVVAFRCLEAAGGAILAAHDGADRAQLAFEARIYGAVAMRRVADADAVTNELAIFVVDREELADQLPLPRLA